MRHEKTVHLLSDLRTQGANVLAIINRGDGEVRQLVSHAVEVDPVSEHLLPLCEVVPLQILPISSQCSGELTWTGRVI